MWDKLIKKTYVPIKGQGPLSLSRVYRVYEVSQVLDSSKANRATSVDVVSGPTPKVLEHSVPLNGSLYTTLIFVMGGSTLSCADNACLSSRHQDSRAACVQKVTK